MLIAVQDHIRPAPRKKQGLRKSGDQAKGPAALLLPNPSAEEDLFFFCLAATALATRGGLFLFSQAPAFSAAAALFRPASSFFAYTAFLTLVYSHVPLSSVDFYMEFPRLADSFLPVRHTPFSPGILPFSKKVECQMPVAPGMVRPSGNMVFENCYYISFFLDVNRDGLVATPKHTDP